MNNVVKLPKSGHTIEIAPGKFAADIPRAAVPKYGFVRLSLCADGSYLPTVTSWGQTIRLTHTLPYDLGLEIDSNVIRRLFEAGFVKGSKPTPYSHLIDIESIFTHIEAAKDPEFWTPERTKRYRSTLSKTRRPGSLPTPTHKPRHVYADDAVGVMSR